jgi:large subunit ribosomal protein L2
MAICVLQSGEQRLIGTAMLCTVGAVSNPDHMNTNRRQGRPFALARPSVRSVRGVVMNPVDHPHGGGEGRTSGGRHPVTPWGKPTKGKRTRSNKSTDKFIIRSRHQRKKKKRKLEWLVQYGKARLLTGIFQEGR